LAELKNEAAAIQTEIGRDDLAKKELGERLDTLTRDLNQATSRLQALRELEENYAGYFRGVKEVMMAAGGPEGLQGIIGVVSSLMTVPKHLEVAVEVALGSDLQDIVTERVDDAKQAIAFLKARNLGRATFLPLDFLHWEFPVKHLEGIWGKPGILGLGRDLIQYDERIQHAVFYLFGNTVLVESLDVAVDLEREGVRNRFVSVAGDVVNPRGVLSGGSHQTRGLLTRQREIRQLDERVKVLEKDLRRLHEEMQAAKNRLGALYARAAEIQAELHRLQMEEATVTKDLQQAERDRREKRNQHAAVQARITQQRMDRLKQAEIVEKCTAGLAEVAAGLESLSASLAERDQANAAMMESLRRLSEEVAVAGEAKKRVSERVDALRTRLAETRQSMDQARADNEAREQERLALLAQREEALLERDEAESEVGELSRAFETVDHEASGLSAENEVRGAALRQLQTEAQRLARDRNERDNTLRELDVQCAEVRAQLEFLEREAEDEFAQTITGIAADLEAAAAAEAEWRRRKEEELERKKAEKKAARRKDQGDPAADAADEPPVPPAPGEPDEEGEDETDLEEGEPVTLPEDDAIADPARLRALVADLRQKLGRMGLVNEAAIEEYAKQSERLTFLSTQRDDLVAAKSQLEQAITRIDETTTQLFNEALEAIRHNFSDMFQQLFNGGRGELVLVQDERFPEPGIDIFAQPPGKNIGGSITLMSGGEKALTAIALMFALFKFRPSPICILDEIDAPLDDVNVGRMCDALRRFAQDTQFLVITHNKVTMSLADTIYGVTMQEPGISKLVSVKFDEVEEQGLLEEPVPVG
ncbi:hypothetical protein HZA57_00375, partial [Candidatus Poribacteria bacterium]|nr:hypothetical protein [Candidatus Poribacteria bacterium]